MDGRASLTLISALVFKNKAQAKGRVFVIRETKRDRCSVLYCWTCTLTLFCWPGWWPWITNQGSRVKDYGFSRHSWLTATAVLRIFRHLQLLSAKIKVLCCKAKKVHQNAPGKTFQFQILDVRCEKRSKNLRTLYFQDAFCFCLAQRKRRLVARCWTLHLNPGILLLILLSWISEPSQDWLQRVWGVKQEGCFPEPEIEQDKWVETWLNCLPSVLFPLSQTVKKNATVQLQSLTKETDDSEITLTVEPETGFGLQSVDTKIHRWWICFANRKIQRAAEICQLVGKLKKPVWSLARTSLVLGKDMTFGSLRNVCSVVLRSFPCSGHAPEVTFEFVLIFRSRFSFRPRGCDHRCCMSKNFQPRRW